MAAALLLLVGAGIALAGNAINGNGGGSNRTSPPEETRTADPRSPVPSADNKAPTIHISRPDPGSVVYGATETLRGRTEAGATLTVTEDTLGAQVEATVQRDGTFEAELSLQPGTNRFTLSAQDAAGNGASARLDVTRATSLASVELSVSATDVELATLPTTLNSTAVVLDENGAFSNGAEAVFSLSPPNGSTQTYEASTVNGEARWAGMVVSGERRALGKWLVTIRVMLPSGEVLRDGGSFTVR